MSATFLETITVLGNPVLIRIEKIQSVILKYGEDIRIMTELQETNYSEHFGKDEKKAVERFEQIKEIIGAM
jgi:hypothetical protein